MKSSACQTVLLLVVFMVGCNGASGPELLNQGVTALNKKQYDDAIHLLTQATERMPKSAEAYNYLGAAYQGKGEQTLAVRAFAKSIAANGNYPPPRFNLGVLCYERQQLDEAIEHLSRFVALQPNHIEGIFYLASARFQKEDLRGAYQNYLSVVQDDPNRPEVLNNLGVISAKLDQTREAETWFNSCIKLDPKYAPAYLNVAILYHHTLNRPAAALDYYQKFLELEPAGPASQRAKQELAQLKQSVTPAARRQEMSSSKAVSVSPPLTEVARETAAPPTTASLPSRVTPAEPPKPAPLTEPAVTSAVSTPVASTIVSDQSAVRTPPSETASLAGPRWPTRSFAKLLSGKRDEALLQFNRGAQYQRDGLLDASVFCYREALKLDPTLTSAYYNLGTALQAEGMANQAIEAYLHALSLQPTFTNARLNLGILFEAQGYLADAAEQYQAIVHEAPNDATAHLALGRLYATQSSTQSLARQHYQRYLDLSPGTGEAKRVQRWLLTNK